MLGMFHEAHQSAKIASASASAATATDRAARVADEVSDLKRKVAHLSLVSQALWELLRENTDFTDEHLLHKIEEIDARDGRSDGKMGATLVPCPKCGRQCNSARGSCLYCGASIQRRHVFE